MTHIQVIREFPFEVEADYEFDGAVIELLNSNAQLKGSPIIPHAHWQFNEASPSSTVADLSPNNFTGTVAGDLTFPAGKLGNAKFFAVPTFVNFPNVFTWDRTQPFSIEFWIKTLDDSGYILQQLTTPGGQLKGFATNILSGRVRLALYGNNLNQLVVEETISVNDDVYHHLVITYDGSSTAAGVKFFLDNIERSKTVIADTLGVTIANTAPTQLGGYGGSNFGGYLDEFVIYQQELTPAQVAERYNAGNGTENLIDGYSIEKPPIRNATPLLFDGAISELLETATIPARTGIRYQFSADGGNIFKYWTGSAWTAITTGQSNTYYYASESNPISEITTALASLAASGNLVFRAFLGSDDSYYTPQLDTLTVTYEKLEEITVYEMCSKFD
ncbi:MAG: LamG-like jellyroll fold domain-containing protein [Candidatus Hodarchaeota archaeon]